MSIYQTVINVYFWEGLCRFLIGMSVHSSPHVVSATMIRLLMCQHSSRFTFCHHFQDLLFRWMLNKLIKQEPGDFIHWERNHTETGEVIMAKIIQSMIMHIDWFFGEYQFQWIYTSLWKNSYVIPKNEECSPVWHADVKNGEFGFEKSYPGIHFWCLKKTMNMRIPKLPFAQRNDLCYWKTGI